MVNWLAKAKMYYFLKNGALPILRECMKIEGLEFMDWLHKIRKESEKERKGRNLSGVDWLREIEKEADQIIQELSVQK